MDLPNASLLEGDELILVLQGATLYAFRRRRMSQHVTARGRRRQGTTRHQLNLEETAAALRAVHAGLLDPVQDPPCPPPRELLRLLK